MTGIHWIDVPTKGRLAITARPRAGDWLEEEINNWKEQGIEIVVSLLESQEEAELELKRESEVCRANDIEFISFPIPDRGLPNSVDEIENLAKVLATKLNNGDSIAVHCRAGIGRSSVVAACVMICAGLDAETAFTMISLARGLRVPDTDEQRKWVLGFKPQKTSLT